MWSESASPSADIHTVHLAKQTQVGWTGLDAMSLSFLLVARMHNYKLLGKRGEGTTAEVLKAQDTRDKRFVAIKMLKGTIASAEAVHRLREVQALRRVSAYPNVVRLHDVLYDRALKRAALIFELMDMNLYELICRRPECLTEDRVLHYTYQLMKGVDHLHRNNIFHRDLKPENVLISDDALKIADLGSCRGIFQKPPFTEYIGTRWYRAPEVLLTDGDYSYKMDLWAVGCIFYEIMSHRPLFPGDGEIDMLHRIHSVLGAPSPALLKRLTTHASQNVTVFPEQNGVPLRRLLPHAPLDAIDLLRLLLAYDPAERISAKAALKHPYFAEIRRFERHLVRQQPPVSTAPSCAPRADNDDEDDATSAATPFVSRPGVPLPAVVARPTVSLPPIHIARS
jgi:renal tumor antigen